MKAVLIKKPLQKRSKAKFQAILQACPRVLAEYGYHKCTTARIALEADVSIGTLYDYFSCKEAVFVAYLDDQLHSSLERVAMNADARNVSPDTLLRELIRVGVDFAHDNREVIQLAFTRFPDAMQTISFADSRARLLDIARRFARSSHLSPNDNDIDRTLYTLTNIVLGFQFRIVAMPDDDYDRETITNLLTDVIRGIVL